MTLIHLMNSPDLLPSAQAAREHRTGSRDALPEWYWESLAAAKARSVAAGDQETAKAVWVLETIGRAQSAFKRAFDSARREAFKEAWDYLDRADIELGFVEPHFADEQDEFGLRHMREHTRRLQSLFPYRWGVSPAILRKRVVCTVCGERITLRSGCGHVVGDIYDGEMCGRRVEDAALLHVALVDSPAQRYSVIELDADLPDFEPIRYLVRALKSPWHAWAVSREERRAHHPLFKDVGRNDRCPCASGKKYKRCCLTSETVFPHFGFAFEHDPPPEMQRLFVRPPGHATLAAVE